RLDFAERVLCSETIQTAPPRTMPPAVAGLAMLGLASLLLGEDAQPGDLEAVLRGLPPNVTTGMDLALWNLACAIRNDAPAAQALRDDSPAELARQYHLGTLPETAQRGLAEFLSKYGHRSVAEIDLGMPRWSDDPTHIIGVLANYLRLDNPDLAPD